MNYATRFNTNLGDPEYDGVKYVTRNFYLHVQKGVRIGVWHTLPRSLSAILKIENKKYERLTFENAIKEHNHKVVVYCHGAFGYRGNGKSISVANKLSLNDCHVFILDYRGFADSSGECSEEGFYIDLKVLYKYIYSLAPGRIYFWGHSMGGAIATRVAADLCEIGKGPQGLMLESSFTSAFDAFIYYPFNTAYRSFSYIYKYAAERTERCCVRMQNNVNILRVTCPITLVHAKDDWIVPFFMSQQLYIIAKDSGKDVKMIIFNEEQQFGHNDCIKSPDFQNILENFLELNNLF
uniref:Hydrolase_4 domain-containing protein n=1 Tax=Strongyloides venezuelensis TaxID=75913 RepID=A0A0K0F6P9_STRVS